MKAIFRSSILFNVLLAGGLACVMINRHAGTKVSAPARQEVDQPPAAIDPAPLPSPVTQSTKFRWSQLEMGNDYRAFIANLRSVGCPENTIEDIVRGNVGRAFDWKRAQLKIDASGDGPWSVSSEAELVTSLLGNPEASGTADARNATSPAQANISQHMGEGNAGNFFSSEGNEVASAAPGFQNASSGQPPGDPSFYPGISGASANSSAGQPSGNSSGKQNGNDAKEVSEPNNPGGQDPLTTPANFNPANSSGPQNGDASDAPVGPPNPLGTDDPFAQSAQDIQDGERTRYLQWFAPQVAANAGGQTLGIDLTDYSPN